MVDTVTLSYAVETSEVLKGEAALDNLTQSTTKADAATKKLNTTNTASARSNKVAAKGAENLAAAQLRASRTARQVSETHTLAAGSVGNLTSQFNDIGIMLAAGQSPLQLAIQQGTQITQVIGPLGAAGAVKGLTSAFLQLISPINLITLGVIAGGAALFQWATRAGESEEAANTFADSLASVKDQAKEAKDAVDVFLAGAANIEVLNVQVRMNELLREAAALREEAATRNGRDRLNRNNAAARLEAEAQSLQDQLDLRTQSIEAADQLAALEGNVQSAIEGTLTSLISTAQARVQANQSAQQYLATLRGEADVQHLIARFGRDSVAVTQLRAQQERAVAVAAINSRNISEQLKQELIDAYDAAERIAGTNLAAGITPAVSEAQRLSEALGISLGIAQAIARVGGGTGASGPDQAVQQVRDATDFGTVGQNGVLSIQSFGGAGTASGRSSGGGSAGGGAGGGVDPYQANLEQLLQSLQTERETIEIWYAESETLLNDHRARKLLGEEEHKEQLVRLEEEYHQRIAGIQDEAAARRLTDSANLFGQLANIAAVGGEKTTKVVAAFEAVQGTINAYGAAIKALNTPGLSLAGRFAAYASVLGAGLKGVAAIKSAGSVSTGSDSSASGGISATEAETVDATPRRTLVEFTGQEPWLGEMFEAIITQIQDSSSDGQIIQVVR